MNEMDEKLSITEVLDEVKDWLESEWPGDMSPSECRKALQDLDELGLYEFDEILKIYKSNLHLSIEDFDFDINDPEFDLKLSEVIADHVCYIEECLGDEDNYGEEDW